MRTIFTVNTVRHDNNGIGSRRTLTEISAKDSMRRGLGHPARPAPAAADNALTVSELTRTIKTLLEGRVGNVTVVGEANGIKASPSGHVYFSLKDSLALIDCVVWRSSAARIRELPKEGAKVTLRGKLTVYEPCGRYQLVVTAIVADSGKGDLWRKFEELKERLAGEGLFDGARKTPLPDSPRVVGIVTSPGGAALRDMIKILSRRAPNLRVVVSPALVQGRGAAEDIARALGALDRWGGADVIVVGRGGGSLEDLWAFNEEPVARAIAAVATPVVSAVGHETDFTIADFVADARAATPSEAAERIAPDQSHLRGRLAHAAVVLSRALAGAVRERRECLRGVARSRSYRRPQEMFMPRWQRLDEVMERFGLAMRRRLDDAARRRDVAEARLRALSPLQVLERGYSVVLNAEGGVVRDAATLAPGERVCALLHRGRIEAEVKSTRPVEE